MEMGLHQIYPAVDTSGLTLLEILDRVGIMDEEIAIDEIDWEGDPEDLVKTRLTPKALEKLYSALDSPNPMAVDRAIEKVIAIDKRLKKDTVPQGNTLNLFGNFDPAYLKQVGQGLKQLFGGGGDAAVIDVLPEKHEGG
jgi:hypothetical protein